MYNIQETAEQLQNELDWQSTPTPMYPEDFIKIVVWAIKRFYVDVNHPGAYDRTLFTTDEEEHVCYDYDFDIVQEEYIYILCKLNFYRKVFNDVAGDAAMSYTTDALSVTGAKEGYKSIQQEIDDLELDRIRVFHKMMARDENEA